MNGVDLMDQKIQSNTTTRKETKVSTLIYTHVLNLAISNAYAIYLWCACNNESTYSKLTHLNVRTIVV